MTEHDGPWAEGTPSWTDLQVEDLSAARAFYSSLFGWEIPEGPAEAGGYTMALRDGRPLAGLGPQMAPGAPSAWSVYFATDDLDAAVSRIAAHGGGILSGPTEIMTAGRMAVAADPAGATFGLWQGRDHLGAGIVGEPGTLSWVELHTNAFETSRDFFAAVFGYEFTAIGSDGERGDEGGGDENGNAAAGGFVYAAFTLPGMGRPIGGVFEDPQISAETPPHWLVWFEVADTDAVAARAGELGATVAVAPTDSPFGRMSMLQGPQGEVFAVIEVSGSATPPR